MRIHRPALSGFAFLIIVLLFATGIANQDSARGGEAPFYRESKGLRTMTAASAAELQRVFAYLDYRWPPGDEAPPIALQRLPGDFAEIPSASERKHLFLRSLLPIVLLENRRLREQRDLAELLLNTPPAKGTVHYAWLKRLMKKYRVKHKMDDPRARTELLRKLDEIPTALVLAQAAIESGWGTSRFALEGNSLFGQWTYKADKGLTPSDRDPEANHAVKAFPNLQASVRAYLHNLNIGHAYAKLRAARAQARAEGRTPPANEIAAQLQRYSQRGEDYVREIRRMLASRDFAVLHPADADPISPRLSVKRGTGRATLSEARN